MVPGGDEDVDIVVAIEAEDGGPDGIADGGGVEGDTCNSEGGTFMIERCGREVGEVCQGIQHAVAAVQGMEFMEVDAASMNKSTIAVGGICEEQHRTFGDGGRHGRSDEGDLGGMQGEHTTKQTIN